MLILDKIIENDNITETQYPYLANNSDPTNSSYIFKLSILGSHDFNFTSLNNTRPCNAILDECLFPYFSHNFTSTSLIRFEAYNPNNSLIGSLARININTQRVIIYTNYTLKMEFYQILIMNDIIWDDCALHDCGAEISFPYGVFMLWPFAGGQIKNLLTNGNNPKLYFLNCSVENFTMLGLNHAYVSFFGYIQVDSQYYTQDISETMSLINLIIVIEW